MTLTQAIKSFIKLEAESMKGPWELERGETCSNVFDSSGKVVHSFSSSSFKNPVFIVAAKNSAPSIIRAQMKIIEKMRNELQDIRDEQIIKGDGSIENFENHLTSLMRSRASEVLAECDALEREFWK